MLAGDLAVSVVLGEAGALIGEEPLGGDGVLAGSVGVDAAGSEFDAGALFGGAGFGGVGVPEGANLVGALQLRGLLIEQVSQRAGLGGFTFQLRPALHVGLVLGFGSPEFGLATVTVRGLEGAGEVRGDVFGCPRLFAFVGADPHAQLAVAHLGFGPAGFVTAESAPGGAP